MAENVLTPEEEREGYRLLFDGHSLNGWGATGRIEGWTVEEGAIKCLAQGGGYLYTQEQFEDFILKIDFKIAPKTNSGIFFRWSDLSDPVNTGLEMQVLDTPGPDRVGVHDCGAVYELVPPKKQMMRPAGEWNHVLITCRGNDIRIDMNGENIIEMDISQWTEPHRNPDGTRTKFKYAWANLPKRGHIGLQDHGGIVWYKNIKIKEL
ncbi:MAG: glycosyl hydrolase [Candidatus Poribacteria bacterium]|nr:MAG: glycosyl hydrolase [Candidatus Poribacteria bacterium]